MKLCKKNVITFGGALLKYSSWYLLFKLKNHKMGIGIMDIRGIPICNPSFFNNRLVYYYNGGFITRTLFIIRVLWFVFQIEKNNPEIS